MEFEAVNDDQRAGLVIATDSFHQLGQHTVTRLSRATNVELFSLSRNVVLPCE